MLLAGGDSFTWGNELPDCDMTKPSKLSWASLLAERKNLRYECCARPGAGNDSIARRTINALDKNPDAKFVAVMWTWPERTEIRLRNDLAESITENIDHDLPWFNLSVYKTLSLEERLKMHGESLANDIWFRNKIKSICDFEQESGLAKLTELYLGLCHREMFLQKTMIDMYALQSYLKEKGIPYVFCGVTSQINDFFRLKHPLVKMIDMSRWLAPEGFVEFSNNAGFTKLPAHHYGPEAHVAWLDKYFHEGLNK